MGDWHPATHTDTHTQNQRSETLVNQAKSSIRQTQTFSHNFTVTRVIHEAQGA